MIDFPIAIIFSASRNCHKNHGICPTLGLDPASFKGHGTDYSMLAVYTADMLENRGIGKTTLKCIFEMPSLGKCGVWK
jgi:hypothetical protein